MRIQTLVGVVSTVVVFGASCANDQSRDDGWDVGESAESPTPPGSAEVEDTSPAPAGLPDIPFPVDENVVIHRHSREYPTFSSSFFKDEEGNGMPHTHAIELEEPGGMLGRNRTTGRVYVIVPGSVLQTPEDHLFEFLSEEYSPDVPTVAWRIETDAWGSVIVGEQLPSPVGGDHAGVYIISHPKPEGPVYRTRTGPRRRSPPTTYTEFNQPGGEGPTIEIQVWRTDEPSLKTHALERRPHRGVLNFDQHRGYYRLPD